VLNNYYIYFYALLYAIFNVAGAAIIKSKLQVVKVTYLQDFFTFMLDIKVMLAIFFIIISMFFSIKALSISSFSSVIPLMTAINFIITVAVGALIFKDHLAISAYIGILFIMVGVVLISNGYAS